LAVECNSLDEVRAHIDQIDQDQVRLIAERSAYVSQAARFKTSNDDVKAPARVAAVIQRVRNLADEYGVEPDIVEAVYQTMISCFIQYELTQHKGET